MPPPLAKWLKATKGIKMQNSDLAVKILLDRKKEYMKTVKAKPVLLERFMDLIGILSSYTFWNE